MKIVRIAIRNFLGISDFEAALSPGVNVVRGANGSGKSSFLKAIWKALRGGKGDALWVIHHIVGGVGKERAADDRSPSTEPILEKGERVAEILVELDGSMTVRRTISVSGTGVQVTKREGPLEVAVRSPQAWLDSLVGPNSLNPVEFFRAPAAERRKILLSVVPAMLKYEDIEDILIRSGTAHATKDIIPRGAIGLAELREIEDALMERRRAVWQEKEHHEEAAKAEANKYPAEYKPVDLPDFQEIMRRYDAAQATVRRVEALRHALEVADVSAANAAELVDELERRLEDARERWAEAEKIRDDTKAECQAAVKAALDPAPIKLELADYERNKAWRSAWDAAASHAAKRDELAASVRAYDEAVQQGIRVEAPRLLWSRLDETPLRGLDIGMEQDRITVKGVDVDNLSQSEQIKIALAIARATSGELKVIGVDGIESLDAASLAEFHKQAAADGFQYVVCQVADGPLRVGL